MSSNSSIEWTDATWNPVRGCSRVSEGCRNCYAERTAIRFAGDGQPDTRRKQGPSGLYRGFVQLTAGGPRWTGKVELIESKLDEPLHWKKPRRIFVNSMSDLFHEGLPFHAIDEVFDAMMRAEWHIYQILTKRGARMYEYFDSTGNRAEYLLKHRGIWLGVSVEDQKTADERIPLLLQTPAAVRFVSYEPALRPVDFSKWFDEGLECNYCQRWRGTEDTAKPDGNPEDPGFLCPNCGEACAHLPLDERLDWVIVGGESGPGARPMHPDWARSVRDQCQASGTSFFFKQWGQWLPTDQLEYVHPATGSNNGFEFEDGLLTWRVGKKAAGRLLDGREWNEFPATARAEGA